jgi:hypothetical protein
MAVPKKKRSKEQVKSRRKIRHFKLLNTKNIKVTKPTNFIQSDAKQEPVEPTIEKICAVCSQTYTLSICYLCFFKDILTQDRIRIEQYMDKMYPIKKNKKK